MSEAGGELSLYFSNQPEPNVNFVGAREARVCVEDKLEGFLCPCVRVEVEIDEAQAVEESGVAPEPLSAQAVKLLICRQSLGKVIQQEVEVTNLAVQFGVHFVPSRCDFAVIVVELGSFSPACNIEKMSKAIF